MAAHPEEIECFRQVTGGFSTDKCYEYVYASRRVFGYIPALGRSDWRYFTSDAYKYAGKWLRSCSQGMGDGGSYWEVFMLDDGSEHNVSWDYDGTLCFRECACGRVCLDHDKIDMVDKTADAITTEEAAITTEEAAITTEEAAIPTPDTIVSEILNEIVENIVFENETDVSKISPLSPNPPISPLPECSLFKRVFGEPTKCGFFDSAEVTTMETKYYFYPNIAEFWCFITSFFYGGSLLLYFVKQEEWFEKWREDMKLPSFVHFSIICSVIVAICSSIYHSLLFEITGCIDCFFAGFIVVTVTMSLFGVSLEYQLFSLLLLAMLYFVMWRYITRITLIVVGIIFPFIMLSCYRMKMYYGMVVILSLSLGIVCFMLDRLEYAPLHSLWHILSGFVITITLYYIIIHGSVSFF